MTHLVERHYRGDLAEAVCAAYRELEGHFLIQRTGPKQIWLESMSDGDKKIGPIPVPAQVARACKVGWDVGGVVARTGKGWRLVEVWNISP